MGLRLVTPPASEPITLAELKAQCRITDSSEDVLLGGMISAARAKAENYTGTSIILQEWVQTLDAFPDHEIELLKSPIASITSVSYVDATGATQVLAGSQYFLDPDSDEFPEGFLLPAYGTTWPVTRDTANAVAVRYFAGYADASAVPRDMRAWLLLTAAFLYAQREAFVINERGQSTTEIPSRFIDSLLDPYRIFKF
jgi:uncharacterized phiE125 gp8 family phage protein